MNDIEETIRTTETKCNDEAFALGGMLCFLLNKLDRAKEYSIKARQKNPTSKAATLLEGWCIASENRTEGTSLFGDTQEILKQMWEREQNEDAMLCLVQIYIKEKLFNEATNILSQASVKLRTFLPVYIERMRLSMNVTEWSHSLDEAQEILRNDPSCIPALSTVCLYFLTHAPNDRSTVRYISELFNAFQQTHQLAPHTLASIIRPLISLSHSSQPVLQEILSGCQRLLPSFQAMLPGAGVNVAAFLNEMGRAALYSGDANWASSLFSQALEANASDVDALCGTIWCMIEKGNTEDAGDQLQFYLDTHDASEMAAVPLYLHARYLWEKEKDRSKCLHVLNQALVHQLTPVFPHISHYRSNISAATFSISSVPPSPQFFSLLDPAVLIRIARTILTHLSSQPIPQDNTPPPILSRLAAVLRMLTAHAPRFRNALFLLGKVCYLCGKFAEAQKVLLTCLEEEEVDLDDVEEKDVRGGRGRGGRSGGKGKSAGKLGGKAGFGGEKIESGFVEASMLLARIAMESGDIDGAKQRMEEAMARNFAIRDEPSYRILSGQLLLRSAPIGVSASSSASASASSVQSAAEEGKQLLLSTLNMAGFRSTGMGGALEGKTRREGGDVQVEASDKAVLYTELANFHARKGEWSECFRYLEEARVELQSTPEEITITLATANALLMKGDISSCIGLLQSIPKDNPSYRQAQMKLADVLLVHKGDKEGFLSVHRALSASSSRKGSCAALVQLGDALLRVGDVEKALDSLMLALKQLQGGADAQQAERMGRRMMKEGAKRRKDGKAVSAVTHIALPGQKRTQMVVRKRIVHSDDFDKPDEEVEELVEEEMDDDFDGVNPDDDDDDDEDFIGEDDDDMSDVQQRIHSTSVSQADNIAAAAQEDLGAIGLNEEALCSKIGRVLISLHYFKKAIAFYEDVVQKHPASGPLRRELASLQMKLKNYSLAEEVMVSGMKKARELAASGRGGSGTSTGVIAGEGSKADGRGGGRENISVELTQNSVADLYMLCCIHRAGNSVSQAIVDLDRALMQQNALLEHLRTISVSSVPVASGVGGAGGMMMMTGADLLQQERHVMAVLCSAKADILSLQGEKEQAIRMLRDVLNYEENNEEALLSLARLSLDGNNLDECEQRCEHLLRLKQNNEEALLMLADIKFQKREFSSTSTRFLSLLKQNPLHFSALHKTIQLLHRAGRLDDVPQLIEDATRESKKLSGSIAPGLHFCIGCYERYRYNYSAAIEHFNLCRRDSEWGVAAVSQMVRVFLNFELERNASEAAARPAPRLSRDEEDALGTARALIREAKEVLKQSMNGERGEERDGAKKRKGMASENGWLDMDVMEFYVLSSAFFGGLTGSTGGRGASAPAPGWSDAQRDLDGLLQQLERFSHAAEAPISETVPVLLALAHYRNRAGDATTTKTLLKEIAAITPTPSLFEEFERAYLMLSEIFVDKKKYDIAEEYCGRCLALNKSSAKAHSLLGLVLEREQSYVSAAEHYEVAWKLRERTDAGLGYRLAFNYMKGGRSMDAIDVCKQVLEKFPDYPKIKEDIIDRCRGMIRMPAPEGTQVTTMATPVSRFGGGKR
ncbi:putative flagellar associated protein [Monocercomonoides exilis]|uniref:putative flagellar associated protein n=1 Tax=Monocercomonoides exilis TaxID=2049356 RepID=UPI0035597416|nr:putative flagellar associated protein [Monocercomonoides exilis]|eukprot:MONOS_6936.1-p1 / transcript=MONOS_6936.1 / gene=MONOS_6936 / organism=Monocercomonoides_exilis_PA203 / gene_product=flagellar associated protein / transcript_product=flagellar associated protein / location=Mono_scaffold00228:10737-16240(+) / protein_length=1578 / sequence_SO=supercontig / SO=protein_coding / is_pseudo=false